MARLSASDSPLSKGMSNSPGKQYRNADESFMRIAIRNSMGDFILSIGITV
jgi:hypothetical protein